MFDSGQGGTVMGKTLRQKLQNLHKVLKGDQIEIDLFPAKNIPFQTNNYDCGIFTVGFAEYVLK